MDHFEILISQHKSILQKIRDAQASSGSAQRAQALDLLRSEVEFHVFLEEAHVYPVLESFESIKGRVSGFWDEHERVRNVLQEVQKAVQDDSEFRSRLSELTLLLEDHLREEEHHAFPEARIVVGSVRLQEMAQKLKEAVSERRIAA